VAKLKHDVDRRRGGDKIDVIDPAGPLLGTDEEAAGTHLSPGVAHAHRQEIMMPEPRLRFGAAEGAGAKWGRDATLRGQAKQGPWRPLRHEELNRLKRALSALVARCQGDEIEECPILYALAAPAEQC
jgi:hypothetical protein